MNFNYSISGFDMRTLIPLFLLFVCLYNVS
jgi:hypothetical protein